MLFYQIGMGFSFACHVLSTFPGDEEGLPDGLVQLLKWAFLAAMWPAAVRSAVVSATWLEGARLTMIQERKKRG